MWLPPLHPSLPAPPHLPSSPACWGAQEGQCTPSPLCWGYASPAPWFMCPTLHTLFVCMPVGARGTACPSQSPLARLCHPPPPGLCTPPHPHAFCYVLRLQILKDTYSLVMTTWVSSN